jgi:hypothetical protein
VLDPQVGTELSGTTGYRSIASGLFRTLPFEPKPICRLLPSTFTVFLIKEDRRQVGFRFFEQPQDIFVRASVGADVSGRDLAKEAVLPSGYRRDGRRKVGVAHLLYS